MRIVIAATCIPFRHSRERCLADSLETALRARGHQVEQVLLPFQPGEDEPAQLLALRLTDLSESSGTTIDRLIAVGGVAGVLPHPRKAIWMVERESALSGRNGDWPPSAAKDESREARANAELTGLRETRRVFPASATGAYRLQIEYGIRGMPVLPFPALPSPQASSAPGGSTFLVLGALTPRGRQAIAIEALRFAPREVRLVFAGPAWDLPHLHHLRRLAEEWGVADRVVFPERGDGPAIHHLLDDAVGTVTLGVEQFAPEEGVLGTFQARRPLVAAQDTGAAADLIKHEVNGLLIAPDPRLLAIVLARLALKPKEARRLGEAGAMAAQRRSVSWEYIAEKLIK